MCDVCEMKLEKWIEKFKPLLDENDCMREFYNLSKKEIEEFGGGYHVWTVLLPDYDVDENREFIVEGFHWANRDFHLVTEVPWKKGEEYSIAMEWDDA